MTNISYSVFSRHGSKWTNISLFIRLPCFFKVSVEYCFTCQFLLSLQLSDPENIKAG